MEQVFQQIDNYIQNNNIVLFMKGTKDLPMCGFSARIVHIFDQLNVVFYDIDVLSDDNIREGIKQFSQWPTIPQLYVKGEFIGGCDIVSQMYADGSLQILFKI